MRPSDWSRIVAGVALVAPMPSVLRAETYLTELQAASVLFPGIKLAPQSAELSPQEAKAIEKVSGERVHSKQIRVLWGPNREALIIDKVVGKHEFITYAVAISSDAKIKGIEIMDYKETYGYEVRRPEWRDQFIGKSSKDPLKLDKDVRNISGATLSSAHVTGGVRRIMHTYEIIKNKG